MRDNFSPNIRLTPNILMVIGTFLIAINLTKTGKQDREYIQRRDDCADLFGGALNMDKFYEKYKLGTEDKRMLLDSKSTRFCSFYRIGSNKR